MTNVTQHNLTGGRMSAILENTSARANNGRITKGDTMEASRLFSNPSPSEAVLLAAAEIFRAGPATEKSKELGELIEQAAGETLAEMDRVLMSQLDPAKEAWFSQRLDYAWARNTLTRVLMGGK